MSALDPSAESQHYSPRKLRDSRASIQRALFLASLSRESATVAQRAAIWEIDRTNYRKKYRVTLLYSSYPVLGTYRVVSGR